MSKYKKKSKKRERRNADVVRCACCDCANERRLGRELKFIGWIKRDGSGTVPVRNARHLKNEDFEILRLSISQDTYIARGFNSYIVRLKT